VIESVYVAYRSGDGATSNDTYPFDNTNVVIRAIIIATRNGNTSAYTNLGSHSSDPNWTNAANWHIYGTQGWPCPPSWPDPKDLSSVPVGSIYQWDSSWGAPTFTWRRMDEQNSSAVTNYPKHNKQYWYDEDSPSYLSVWGTVESGHHLPVGLYRYRVKVSYEGRTRQSGKEDVATRTPVRSSSTFGIVVPPSGELRAARLRRMNYLQWIYSYLRDAYEWGGHWYGGRVSNGAWVGGSKDYDGYGIDCSGTVSCGARWAGYHWVKPYYWRQGTSSLATNSYSEGISDVDVEPGDILDDPGDHVRSIYFVHPDNKDSVSLIAAEFDKGVRDKIYRSIDEEKSAGYLLRRLKAH